MAKANNPKAAKTARIYLILTILFTLSTCVWAGFRIFHAIQFDLGCGAFLKRASSANTIELAQVQLQSAIDFAENNNLTEGVVSIFLRNPSNDIGFWYQNMTAANEELLSIPEDASQLERTNVLMKLRESLTDTTSGSSSVTVPDGISIYPNNVAYFWWSLISMVGATLFLILWGIYFEKATGKKIITTTTTTVQFGKSK